MELKEYKNINENIYTHTFDNGLKLTFIKKEGFKSIYAGVLVKFGSVYNKVLYNNNIIDIPTGTAHFLEHKLFVDEDGNDISYKFNELGLECNAGTNFNTTVYYFTGINNLEKGLNILLDFVQTPRYTEQSVESEKNIIIQEVLMYKDNPSERLYFGMLENLFDNYPIRNDVCGTIDDINNMTKKTLDLCHKMFYHPENMEVVVSGDLDPEYLINLISENQSKKTFTNFITGQPIYEKNINVIKKRKIKMDINNSKVSIGFKFPFNIESNENKNYIYDESLLWKILFVFAFGPRTKFSQRLLDNNIINDTLDFTLMIDKHTGFLIVSADTNKSDEFINAFRRRLKTLDKIKIDEEILELEKRTIYGSFINSTNNVYMLASKILDNISAWFIFTIPLFLVLPTIELWTIFLV